MAAQTDVDALADGAAALCVSYDHTRFGTYVPCVPPFFPDAGISVRNPTEHRGKFYLVTIGTKPGIYTSW